MGALNKANGRAVAKAFGPVQRWSATYDGKAPAILLTTAAATYTCATPAPEYRALFTDAQEQVALCHALVQALRGKEGAQLGFEGALAALNRAKAVKGYVSVRDAVLLNGAFVLGQLPAMQVAVGKALDLEACKFVSELRAEVRLRYCAATLPFHVCFLLHPREYGVVHGACSAMVRKLRRRCAAEVWRTAHAQGPRHRQHLHPRARQPRGGRARGGAGRRRRRGRRADGRGHS